MLSRVLGPLAPLFLCINVLLSFLWLTTSHKLETLQTAHKALSVDYKECVESKATLKDSYEITLGTIKSQREALEKVKDKEHTEVVDILTYKPQCINNPSGEKHEVDIDAPLDPEFIRVSEGSN